MTLAWLLYADSMGRLKLTAAAVGAVFLVVVVWWGNSRWIKFSDRNDLAAVSGFQLANPSGLAVYSSFGLQLRKKGVWISNDEKIFPRKIKVVLDDDFRISCPEYDAQRQLVRGMALTGDQDGQMLVYVWVRRDFLARRSAARETTRYIAGCLNQASLQPVVPLVSALPLSRAESLLVSLFPIKITYAESL